MVSISAFVKFFAFSALSMNVVTADSSSESSDDGRVRCDKSGFDGSFCKGGIDYFWPEKYCSGDSSSSDSSSEYGFDCAAMCCTWGACLPDGPPCDGSKYHCTCEPGPYPTTRRNLRDEVETLQTLLVQGFETE